MTAMVVSRSLIRGSSGKPRPSCSATWSTNAPYSGSLSTSMSAVSVTPSTEVNDAFPSDQMVAIPAAPIRVKEQCRLSGDPGNAYPHLDGGDPSVGRGHRHGGVVLDAAAVQRRRQGCRHRYFLRTGRAEEQIHEVRSEVDHAPAAGALDVDHPWTAVDQVAVGRARDELGALVNRASGLGQPAVGRTSTLHEVTAIGTPAASAATRTSTSSCNDIPAGFSTTSGIRRAMRARQTSRISSCGTKTYASSASPWAASTSSQDGREARPRVWQGAPCATGRGR